VNRCFQLLSFKRR